MLEAIAGIFLLLISHKYITKVVTAMFGQELIEDPKDFLGNFFMHLANNFSLRMHIFIGLYMLVHGLVNIGIVVALTHKKLWAFPIVGGLLVIFIIYQVYMVIHKFSIIMILLIIIDLVIISLLRFEYLKQKELLEKQMHKKHR